MADGRESQFRISVVVFSFIGLVVVAGLVVSTLGWFWNPNTGPPTQTNSSSQTYPGGTDIEAVRSNVLNYITYINDRNPPAAGGFYGVSSIISWTGVAEPWMGNYSKDGAIVRLNQFTN